MSEGNNNRGRGRGRGHFRGRGEGRRGHWNGGDGDRNRDAMPEWVPDCGAPKFPLPESYTAAVAANGDGKTVMTSVSEEECGITEFVSADVPGFSAILKHLYSDFNVNEVSTDGSVVRLTSTDLPVDGDRDGAPETPTDASCFPAYSDLPETDREVLSELQFTRVLRLATKSLGSVENSAPSDAVTVDVTNLDKERRKRLHDVVKVRFGHLCSNTENVHERDAATGAATKKQTVIKIQYKTPGSEDGREKRRRETRWPQDRPKFLEFSLYKQDVDQMEAVHVLARYIAGNAHHYSNHRAHKGVARSFSFAGTKDKRGRTTQRATAAWVDAADLLEAARKTTIKGPPAYSPLRFSQQLAVGDFKYVDRELKLGDLRGNRFEVVLRNVVVAAGDASVESSVDAALSSLRDRGFVNYFGLQRFGTTSVKTSDVGLSLIKKDWTGAIEKIMLPRPNDRGNLRWAREHWWQHRDAGVALRLLGKKGANSAEAKLLWGLKTHDAKDQMGALGAIPRHVRCMYLHAYQSLVFNRVASARIAKFGLRVLVGDLYFEEGCEDEADVDEGVEVAEDEEEQNGEKDADDATSEAAGKATPKPQARPVLKVTEADLEKVRIERVVLPLPGEDVEYPDNEVGKMYMEEMARDGLDEAAFKDTTHKQYSLPGAYRNLIGKVEDLEWRLVRYDDPREPLALSELEKKEGKELEEIEEGKYAAAVVSFTLRSSHYATMALREATKTSTARDVQGRMSEEHRETKKREAEDDKEDKVEEVEPKKAKMEEEEVKAEEATKD